MFFVCTRVHECMRVYACDTLFRDFYGVNTKDTVLQASPLTFDPSVVEMFTTLSSGATLLLVPEILKRIPSQLAEIITNRHKVTIVQVYFL